MREEKKTRAASAGFGLLLRRQYLLWWIFSVNFVLAAMATLPFASSVAGVMGHSVESRHLLGQFDVGVFGALMMKPQIGGRGSFFLFPAIFFVFMLLAEGGVLVSYREDRRMSTGEFFGAGGRYFWRFVRLAVCLGILMIPFYIAWNAISGWSDSLAANSPNPVSGFRVEVIYGTLLVLLLMAVRLWFDMAQVRIVGENERSVLRALRWSLVTTVRSFGSLYWLFFRISVAAWIEMALLFWIWMDYVPHEHIGLSFLLAQASLILWLGARLWQRAGETMWYARRIDMPPPAAPAPPFPPAEPLPVTPEA